MLFHWGSGVLNDTFNTPPIHPAGSWSWIVHHIIITHTHDTPPPPATTHHTAHSTQAQTVARQQPSAPPQPAACAWWVVGVNGARGRPAACMWSMPVVRCGDSGWCGGGPPDADAVIDAAYL
jgi:hypothetical protein